MNSLFNAQRQFVVTLTFISIDWKTLGDIEIDLELKPESKSFFILFPFLQFISQEFSMNLNIIHSLYRDFSNGVIDRP